MSDLILHFRFLINFCVICKLGLAISCHHFWIQGANEGCPQYAKTPGYHITMCAAILNPSVSRPSLAPLT